MEVITKNSSETFELGRKIGSSLNDRSNGVILALTGDLGAGKTTFIQGLAEGLGIKAKIVSPTFILMRSYKAQGISQLTLYHLDLYRLEGNIKDQVRQLGVFDIWSDPDNIIAIEWAEKIEDILPEGVMKIKFEVIDDGKARKISY